MAKTKTTKAKKKSRAVDKLPEVGPLTSRKIKCQLCGRSFSRITATHVETIHGMSLDTYAAAGYAITPKEQAKRITIQFEGSGLHQLASEIIQHPEFLATAATGVASKMLAQDNKLRLHLVANQLLGRRLARLEAIEELEDRAIEQLMQPWRLEEGGDGGSETPTSELLSVLQTLSQQRTRAEDIVLRHLKMLMDEDKAPITKHGAAGDYSGEVERSSLEDAGVSEEERKRIGNLLKLIDQKKKKDNKAALVIDAKGTIDPEADSEQATGEEPSEGS